MKMENRKKIILCKCIHNNLLDTKKVETIESDLTKIDCHVILVDDLCGAIINKNSDILDAINSDAQTVIMACPKRAVEWLLKSAEINIDLNKPEYINLHTASPDVVSNLNLGEVIDSQKPPQINIQSTDNWVPWFPVLDFDRCTHCKQCMSFCLFKVYEVDADDRVVVKNPQNCKNNCPACARICPEIAIMFPKLNESPINGDVVTADDESKNLRLDLDKINDGNMYDALKARNAKNRAKLLKRSNIEKALEERKKCGCDPGSPFKMDIS